ncbi:MAG TPA: hypothetical protein C5S51_10650 [Methanosarcinaceae archaeon]|nr:hypothetical protein [Methanosarcinaceae archaeon]
MAILFGDTDDPSGTEVTHKKGYYNQISIAQPVVITGKYEIKVHLEDSYDGGLSKVFVSSFLPMSVISTSSELISTDSNSDIYVSSVESNVLSEPSVLVESEVISSTTSSYSDDSSSNDVEKISDNSEFQQVDEELADESVIERIETEPDNSSDDGKINLLFLLLMFVLILGVIIKSRKKKVDESQKPKADLQLPVTNNKPTTSSSFGYKGAKINYKFKVKNPTSEPISDIKVHIFVPDVFLLENNEKSISMLEPNESKTVTFEIRPTGECGDCNVSGKMNYYDYGTKKRQEIDLETKSLSVVCPLLKIKDITIAEWRNTTSHFVKTEETTREISMPAETLFSMASRVVEDMNMFMLEPEINSTEQLFNGVARFYGEGVKELKYAAQIEVVGGAKKSKLILKAWAEREDALTGFYHGLLDEIEKRVQVKGYIDDSIVQNFYHNGDNIGTQVKDSFVYKSNVGNVDADTCPQCGKEKAEGEPFCSGCGAKF